MATTTKRARARHGQGTIYYDTSRERWVGQAWIEGKRRKVTATSEKEATRLLGRLIHGDPAERDTDKKATVAAVLADWLASIEKRTDLAPITVEMHRWAVDLWTKDLGKVKAADLTVERIDAGLAAMAKPGRLSPRGLGKASLLKARGTLRQALQWAVKRRRLTYNAATFAELPNLTKKERITAKGAATKRDRIALDADQLAALVAVLDGHPRLGLYLLSARMGLRPGEAAGVCTDALDLDAATPTVSVRRAVQLTRGRPHLVNTLKTKRARRTLALPADVVAVLRDAVQVAEEGGLLFPAADGGPLWPSTVRAELAELCERAEVPTITPNELRHTAATHLSDAGLSSRQVADILGHASTAMVEATYRHAPEVVRGAEVVTLGAEAV